MVLPDSSHRIVCGFIISNIQLGVCYKSIRRKGTIRAQGQYSAFSLRNQKSIAVISIPSTSGIKYPSMSIRRSKLRTAPVLIDLDRAVRTQPNKKNIRNAPHIQKI